MDLTNLLISLVKDDVELGMGLIESGTVNIYEIDIKRMVDNGWSLHTTTYFKAGSKSDWIISFNQNGCEYELIRWRII